MVDSSELNIACKTAVISDEDIANVLEKIPETTKKI